MAVAFCKVRARVSGNPKGSEHDYYVDPASVSLLVDNGQETGLWTSGLTLTVVEPVAQLIERLQQT